MSAVPFPEDEYVLKLGKLSYAVSYLEWGILGDLPHLQGVPSSLSVKALAGLTTGQIARTIKDVLAKGGLSQEVHKWFQAGADHLSAVAKERNSVLHARPATIGGAQRLHRWEPSRSESFPITMEKLDELLADVDDRIRDMTSRRLLQT